VLTGLGREMLEVAKGRRSGSLTVVGTGIAVGQMTAEARASIEGADKVLYCVADAATERLIQRINPSAESLYVFMTTTSDVQSLMDKWCSELWSAYGKVLKSAWSSTAIRVSSFIHPTKRLNEPARKDSMQKCFRQFRL